MQNDKRFGGLTIVGSGNVAWRLTDAFTGNGIKVDYLLSKSSRGQQLAANYGLRRVNNPEDIEGEGIVLLCVRDDAVNEAFARRFSESVLLCHTAGSVPLSALGERRRKGVFYPLQTLSKNRRLSFEQVPLCLEAAAKEDLELLAALAGSISRDVRFLNSQQRLHTHLAAVFVSNFVNRLYGIAGEILATEGVDFDILKPLIEEVAAKIKDVEPAEAQTGPALRGDGKVIDKHLQLLENQPEYKEIYQIITNSIIKHKKEK